MMMNIENWMEPQEVFEELFYDLQKQAEADPAAALALDLIYAMEKSLHKRKQLSEAVNACILVELIEPVRELTSFSVELQKRMETVGDGGPVMIVR
jgi:hypothetical protein